MAAKVTVAEKRARSKQELENALSTAEALLVATSAFASLTWRSAKPDFEVTQPAYSEDDPTLSVRVFGADKAHGGIAILTDANETQLAGPSLLDDMLIGWRDSSHPYMRELARKLNQARGEFWAAV
jgi:hypothetical protein